MAKKENKSAGELIVEALTVLDGEEKTNSRDEAITYLNKAKRALDRPV